jgi:uncharacterized repeat protein (TIGR02543 family)
MMSVSLTARWLVNVTLDPNGGTLQSLPQGVRRDLLAITDTPLGMSLIEQTPTRIGYLFTGWVCSNGLPFTPYTIVSDNITIYAQWERTHFTQYWTNFNLNDGHDPYTVWSGQLEWVTFEGETVTVPDIIERPGFEFIHWTSNSDGTGSIRLPGQTFNVTGHSSYFAQWEQQQATAAIVFHIDGSGQILSEAAVAALPANMRPITVPLEENNGRFWIQTSSQQWQNFAAREWNVFGGEPISPAEELRGPALWGWFTGARLTINRVRFGVQSRRPVVGTSGEQIASWLANGIPASYLQYGTLNVFGIWSLWGDVNDDDSVTGFDLVLMEQFFADDAVRILNSQLPPALQRPLPFNVVINQYAGNVSVSGSISGFDLVMMEQFFADEAVRNLNSQLPPALHRPLPFNVVLGQRP